METGVCLFDWERVRVDRGGFWAEWIWFITWVGLGKYYKGMGLVDLGQSYKKGWV